jgi:hypothetical protein
VCHVQTCDVAIAKALRRLADCQQVGFSVAGGTLWLFAVRRTLPWIKTNVIEKFASLFPRKQEGQSFQKAGGGVFISRTRKDRGSLIQTRQIE